MWQAEGTGVWVAGLETVMSVHLETMHRPRTSALAYRQDAAHGVCVWVHMGPVGSSCGQAGRARSVEATPVGRSR